MTFRPGPLARDERGATLVEFGLIAPVLLLMMLGLFDMSYNYYVQSQMQGAIQNAARDSGIEGAQLEYEAIDKRVLEAVRQIAPDANVQFRRRSYSSFSDVDRAEDFSDLNGDGVCNDGEPFEDANANGTWDQDRGTDGGGGARDAVLYVVNVEYPRQFAAASFVGLSKTVEMSATTVLRNQPYGKVVDNTAVGNCT
ncbi:TadE family protein [Qipengyuania sp. JC766]|uniref:TadE/TadG family type IV pilus assembly protein n=1 Tax=Qipengyuania sp. JC766 TaxID=3232139 RepID=UPI003459DA19